MTIEELKEICIKREITFIPHHACAICGIDVGWYLFGRWPPYEIAFSGACGCSSMSYAEPDTWKNIAKWVLDSDGNPREQYKEMLHY